jgi:hypothetical protein
MESVLQELLERTAEGFERNALYRPKRNARLANRDV